MHTVLLAKKPLFAPDSGFISAAEFARMLCGSPALVSLKPRVCKSEWRECAIVVTGDGRFLGTVQATSGNRILVAGGPLGAMLAAVATGIKDARFKVVEPGF